MTLLAKPLAHYVVPPIVACVVAMLLVSPAAAGLSVITFDEETGSTGGNSDQTVGWQFDVLESITVTALAWYDDGHDGLSRGHETGIWAPNGALLASVVIPEGTAAPLDGQWRIAPIDPIVLVPDLGYIVGGFNGLDSTDRLAFDVEQTVHPSLHFVDATFAPATGNFERPTRFSSAQNGFYGPSFQIVPGPGAAGVLLVGLLLAGRRRV